MRLNIALQRYRVWKSQKACAAAGDMRIKLKSVFFVITLMMVITVIE